MRRLAITAILLAACFERGRARPHEDAGVAAVARDAAVVVAPTHAEPRGAPDPDATITIALEAEPPTLDPILGADAVTQRIVAGDVFEGLVCPGPRLGDAPVACLADRWESDATGTRWTFHLREATWHDGGAVTAADVRATFARVQAEASWLAGELDDLEGVEITGAREVTLRFTHARSDRLARLARIPIAPTAASTGTGPLRVVAWKPGDRIELARWDGYWGTPAAPARVVYRRFLDRDQALRALAAGGVDVVVQVPVDEASTFGAAHPELGTFAYRLPAYLAAIYNARRPALATADSRRALTALLDRDGLAARLLHTHAITGPFPDGDPGHDPTVAPIAFDRRLAARLLGGARPHVEILVPQGSTTMAKVADIWAADARGIADLAVVQVPFGDLLARLAAGDFDVALLSMTTGAELDLSPQLSSRSPPESAWPGLRDAELDRLLDAARAEPDAGRRADLRRALHRRIAELVPMAFLAPDVRLGLARRDVGGVADASEGAPPRAARMWRSR